MQKHNFHPHKRAEVVILNKDLDSLFSEEIVKEDNEETETLASPQY